MTWLKGDAHWVWPWGHPLRTSAKLHCDVCVLEVLLLRCLGLWLSLVQDTEGDGRRTGGRKAVHSPQPPALGGWRVAMDLYLSNCIKAAEAAASKAASSSLKSDKDACSTVSGDPSIALICSLPFCFRPTARIMGKESGLTGGNRIEIFTTSDQGNRWLEVPQVWQDPEVGWWLRKWRGRVLVCSQPVPATQVPSNLGCAL